MLVETGSLMVVSGLRKPACEARNRLTNHEGWTVGLRSSTESNPLGLWGRKWRLRLGNGLAQGHPAGGSPDILLFSVVGQERALALGRLPKTAQ